MTTRRIHRIGRFATGFPAVLAHPARRAAALALVLVAGAAHADGTDLLRSSDAFRLSASLAGSEITVRYRMAEGYYLYRDKFQFATDPAKALARAPQLPKGIPKEDEFFGKVEIFRNEVVIRIPVRLAKGRDQVVLKARSQGCADAGVCYPPREDVVTLADGQGFVSPASDRPPGHRSLLDELK